MLDHPLEDYFSYHPTKDPGTLALYRTINTELFFTCCRLLNTAERENIDIIELNLNQFIDDLKLSDTFKGWVNQAKCAGIGAARYQLADRREADILQHMQIVRMFCNQGVTLSRFSSELTVTTPTRIGA